MTDDIEEVPFLVSLLPAGSGNLSSANWIVGFYFDLTTKTDLGLAYGVAGPDVAFGVPLSSPYQSYSVNDGGTLFGDLSCNNFTMQGGVAFVLLGTLSASRGTIGSGTQLTLDASALLSVTNYLTVQGTVTNAGRIVGNMTTAGAGLILHASGARIINQSGASISGYTGIGTYLGNADYNVVNQGIIAGNTTSGVGVSMWGGSITNQSGGTISGGFGIFSENVLTVVNIAGSIAGNPTLNQGIGIELADGGTVTNQGGGTISGRDAIDAVTAGIVTIVNYGSIAGNTASGFGISFRDGSVTNQSSASISGLFGVSGDGDALTVVNAGSIAGNPTRLLGGVGIDLANGNNVAINQSTGKISGFTGIAGEFGTTTVVNYGSITANYGVYFNAGGECHQPKLRLDQRAFRDFWQRHQCCDRYEPRYHHGEHILIKRNRHCPSERQRHQPKVCLDQRV
jgi:hypothetical protein